MFEYKTEISLSYYSYYWCSIYSAQEMAALFPDRVIAIRGGIDNISQAEMAISSKLAECIDHEMQQGMVCIFFHRLVI